jgi:hypothetical protein
MCKELGRLFQGFTCKLEAIHTVQGTNTCIFISRKDIPQGKKATYIRIVSEMRPQKADPYRVRCTVGGNQIDFPGDKSTKVAELVTIKTFCLRSCKRCPSKAGIIDSLVTDDTAQQQSARRQFLLFLQNTMDTPATKALRFKAYQVFFKAHQVCQSSMLHSESAIASSLDHSELRVIDDGRLQP